MAPRDEQQALLAKERRAPSSRFNLRNWIVPVIVLAQISIFVFAWTFAGLLIHKTIPLPDGDAIWVQKNPSDAQVIVTLVSTVLALINSLLLGKAVQYALVHRLSRVPIHLHTMVEWAKLAQRTVSLNPRRPSWTLLSVAWVGLLSFLTTAWSSLLAPESIVIYHPLEGSEINLLSPSVSDVFSKFPFPHPVFNMTLANGNALVFQYNDIDIQGTLVDAGVWAASARSSSSNPLGTNFIRVYGSSYVSNTSTGGIYPTGDLAEPPSSSFLLGIGNPSYQGLSRTYNVTQQGFTANVSCRTPTSTDPVIALNLTNSAQISAGGDTWALDTYSWSTNCSSGTEYSTSGVTIASGIFPGGRDPLPGENGLLMTAICYNQSFSGSSNQSFLVLLDSPSNSTYSFAPQVCQVTPLVTTVRATYDQSSIINVVQPPLEQHALPDPTSSSYAGILTSFPASTIWSVFVKSQGLTANTAGDSLLALSYGGNHTPTSIIENYLRGMVEYIGSLMAQEVAFASPSNPDETVRFNGTINAHTIGWTFHPRTHGPSVAAITLVTVLTVAAGVLAMVPVGRDRVAYAFDPTDSMDVLLAASAGDVPKALSASASSSVGGDDHPGGGRGGGEELRVRVVLGTTTEGRPALRTHDVEDVARRGSV